MPTILLVEDDDQIRQIEADYLKRERYQVIEAATGSLALELFGQQAIDCVILDLNLPEVDGITVCRSIREQSGVPIIMVTARANEIDELVGLEVGADDYIKKPFSPKVLVARVKALLKRPDLIQGQAVLTQGNVTLDIPSRVATKKGKTLALTATQFNLLYRLMSSPGKVFTREDLIESGYNKDLPPDIYDRTIDSHIKNIRKAIEDNPKRPKLLHTVRGHGYKFINR